MRLYQVKIKPIWAIVSLMFIVPIFFFFNPNFGVAAIRIGQTQIFQVLSLVLFSLFIIQNVYLGAFTLLSVILYTYFGFPAPSGVTLLNILSGMFIYEAVYRIVDFENYKTIFNAMIWFALLNLVYVAIQLNGGDFIFREWGLNEFQRGAMGFMGLKAIMGMMFALAIPFIAGVSPNLSLLIFIPILLSESSCAVGGAIVAYLWHLWNYSKKLFKIVVGIMLVGGCLYAYNDSHAGMFSDRASMWKLVLEDSVKCPMTGYGLDSFRSLTPNKDYMYVKNVRTKKSFRIKATDLIEYESALKLPEGKYSSHYKVGDTLDIWDNPHNELIQLLFEFGIIPFIILGFLIRDIIRRFDYSEYQIPIVGMFLSLIVVSVGQFPFHLARIGFYPIIFYAIYCKLDDFNQNKVRGELNYGT